MQTSTNILNKISWIDIMGFCGWLYQSWGWGGWPVTYATFDPATVSWSFWLTNNNLTLSHWSDWTHSYWYSTISKTSGKWYFEISAISWFGQLGIQWTWWKYAISPEWIKLQNEYWVSVYWTYWANAFATVPTVVWFMLDLDNNEIGFSINWTSYWVAFSITPWEYNLYIKDISESSYIANFWATPFTYSVPSGYNAWLFTN